MRLIEAARTAYIIAHTEETGQLVAVLESEGFEVVVLRRDYPGAEAQYSRMARCLLNHCDAWRRIADGGLPAIVVEADFVPVVGFANREAVFDPSEDDRAVGWLYAGGPVVYSVDEHRRAIGHSSTTVAMLVTPTGAKALLEFGQREISESRGGYTPWDTYASHRLRREMSIATYQPFRQYGEHGGRANAEHVQHGVRGWHQADRLLGRLAFLPAYAEGSKVRYWFVRRRANLRGLMRLLLFRYFEYPAFKASRQKTALLGYAMRRWLW